MLGFAAGTGAMRGSTASCSVGYSQRHLLLKTEFKTDGPLKSRTWDLSAGVFRVLVLISPPNS